MNEDVFKRLEIEIKKTYYAYDRYKVQDTFALLYHANELTPTELGSFVRITDKFVKIDNHTDFLIFAFSREEDVFKASQNLLAKLDKFFNDRESAISINSFDPSNSPRMVVNKLTQTLIEIQKSGYSRVEDERVLGHNLVR